MSQGTPRTTAVNRLTLIPHLMVFAVLLIAGVYYGGQNGPIWAGGTYLVWSIGSRFVIPGAHRRGVRLTRAKRWSEAEAEFRSSYEFFSRHKWIDRYRSIVMLSASGVSYREMALVNMAACQLQQKHVDQAKATYRQTLEEFPKSSIAAAALETIAAIEGT